MLLDDNGLFLLTRPLRDVTRCNIIEPIFNQFLLTRPLRDVTVQKCFVRYAYCQFLLTRPLRDVTYLSQYLCNLYIFLLTRPLRDVTR